jgi:LuxR family maltose regulon positive regulatory protein
MLDALDRDNLFLVPLDRERRDYRYQHLFGEFLRARLQRQSPSHALRLHQRAADWYAAQGDHRLAILHVLSAEYALCSAQQSHMHAATAQMTR